MTQNTSKTLLALTNASASGADIAKDNPFWRGVQIGVNITSITGTSPSLTVVVEGFNEASNSYYTLLQSAALTTADFTLLTVYPGVTAAANVSASQALPNTWRVRYVIAGTTPSVSATVGANLIV